MGATKKMCPLLTKSENSAKTYFRNCSNYPNCLDFEIIGGLYFSVSLRNKYCFIKCYNTNLRIQQKLPYQIPPNFVRLN